MLLLGAPVTQFYIRQRQTKLHLHRLTLSDVLHEFWGQTNLQLQPKDGTETGLSSSLVWAWNL